jgi:hypothetical protein
MLKTVPPVGAAIVPQEAQSVSKPASPSSSKSSVIDFTDDDDSDGSDYYATVDDYQDV